jgi:hypothetical protein
MRIDGIAASSHLDSSGEVLDIHGHDISDLVSGKGVLNWEHAPVESGADNILGEITFAKKIFGPKDCDNDRQLGYWNSCQKPFVYIIAELFDDEMHPGALAAAAIIRHYARKGEKILAGFSIEGSTLEREGNELKRSVGRRVALTLRPCNKSCVSGLLEDPQMAEIYRKSEAGFDGKYLCEVNTIILEEDPFEALAESANALVKTLTAGGYNVAPSSLVGGSALSREHIIPRTELNSMKAKFRDWPRSRPLKEWLKAELPNVSESYIDHFSEVAHQVSLKKGLKLAHRVSPSYSDNKAATDEQKRLVDGIHLAGFVPYDPGHSSFRNQIHQAKNDAGEEVIVKPSKRVLGAQGDFDTARHAAAYHVAAKELGMGNHVPETSHFFLRHDGNPVLYQAIKKVPGAVPLSEHPEAQKHIDAARANGDLQKLFLTDFILGAGWDRRPQNVLVSPEGKLMHVDNDESFMHHDHTPSSYVAHPISGRTEFANDRVFPHVRDWIMNLNPAKLNYALKHHGLGMHESVSAEWTIKQLKNLLATNPNPTMGEVYNVVSGRKTFPSSPLKLSETVKACEELMKNLELEGMDATVLKQYRREAIFSEAAGRLISALGYHFVDAGDVAHLVKTLKLS